MVIFYFFIFVYYDYASFNHDYTPSLMLKAYIMQLRKMKFKKFRNLVFQSLGRMEGKKQ
jgi:hypothetical protein